MSANSEIDLTRERLIALERFFTEEDARLATAQGETIRQLLLTALSSDAEEAFNDLVYVMETAVKLGMVEEEQVMPAFLELFALRKALDEAAHERMAGIQRLLRSLLLGE